jgi:DNA replication protein
MPDESGDSVPVDREFFTGALPRISDLAELKLLLHVLDVSSQLKDSAVPLRRLFDPSIVKSVCGDASPEPGELRIGRVLERALANGSLLRITVRNAGSQEAYVLPATVANRAKIDGLYTGEAGLAGLPEVSDDADVTLYRPNVFSIYEQHIGPLTPIVAEQLREAERSYPRAWLERAIELAGEYEHRSWRYVEAILADWERAGAPTRS